MHIHSEPLDSHTRQPQPADMPLSPTLLWAQRKDRLIISIDLQDCKDPKVELQNADGHGRLIFKGLAHSHAVGEAPLRSQRLAAP